MPREATQQVQKIYVPGDAHYDSVLTDFGVGYMQSTEQFVARRVLTQVNVRHRSNKYNIWSRADQNRDEFRLRAPSTEAPVVTKSLSRDTYYADRWSLAYDIEDDERRDADPIMNLEEDATQALLLKGLIKQELLFASTFMASASWTDVKTGVSGTPATDQLLQWNDASSDPIGDVRAAATRVQLASGGYRPNVLVLGQQVADAIADHPDFIDRVKYGGSNGQPAMISRQAMAALFEVQSVEVMGAVYNTAAEGATESNAFIGGKSALLGYRTPTYSASTPTFGAQFNWTPGVGVNGVMIKNFRMEAIDSDRIEGNMWFDQKLTAQDLGAFFDGIVA